MAEKELEAQSDGDLREPGVVLLFSAGVLHHEVFPLTSEPLEIGRAQLGDVELNDNFMSRQHSRIAYADGRFIVTDCGSRNGTTVDAQPFTGTIQSDRFSLVRAGETLLLLSHDVRRYREAPVRGDDEVVLGPSMQAAFASLSSARDAHVRGEVGTGRAFAARYFHDHGPTPEGPFISVNCEGLPAATAEAALFGAAGNVGYLQRAAHGTLFLDEVAALPQDVQRRLAATMAARPSAPGSSAPIRVCLTSKVNQPRALSKRELAAEFVDQVALTSVYLPPLRERAEEIPSFIARELARCSTLQAHASLVEVCMVRPWPGNVRELLMEVRNAGAVAVEQKARDVRAAHLSATAGLALSHPDRFETLEESPAAIARSSRGGGAPSNSGNQ